MPAAEALEVPARKVGKSRAARRALGPTIVAAVLLFVAVAGVSAQQNRTVEGVVLNADNHAVANAVVYLKNKRTQAVRSYITGTDGKYEFHALAPNTDYTLHAVYQDASSHERVVSGYDTQTTIHLDLKLPLR